MEKIRMSLQFIGPSPFGKGPPVLFSQGGKYIDITIRPGPDDRQAVRAVEKFPS
jgi:hypothetical protein